MNDLENLYQIWKKHPLIVTDSRKVTPGSLFFALKGENFNGNNFAAQALESGAEYAIVDEKSDIHNDRLIKVWDVLETLQQLSLYHRKKINIPVIAITGSNGKTTTKELVNAVLLKKFKTVATDGNLNNHIGVPLTLLSIRDDTEIAIVEMGANHQKEIDFLCRLALPSFGMITNIGKAHLEGFGGFQGVISAKTELYRYILETEGTIFINSDDELLSNHSKNIKKITYGMNSGADVHGIILSGDPFVQIEAAFPEKIILKTHLFGTYNATNIIAACCIGKHFGLSPEVIKEAIEEYEPINSRSQIMQTSKNRIILDAYNANPSSMTEAIRNFILLPAENKVYILGDMLELGDESENEHQEILNLLEQVNAKNVFLVGPEFLRVNKKNEWLCFDDSDLARLWLGHHSVKDSDILLKGSRGIMLEKILDVL